MMSSVRLRSSSLIARPLYHKELQLPTIVDSRIYRSGHGAHFFFGLAGFVALSGVEHIDTMLKGSFDDFLII